MGVVSRPVPGRAREGAGGGLASSRAAEGWTPADTPTPLPATPSSSAQRFLTLGAGMVNRACWDLSPHPGKVGEAFPLGLGAGATASQDTAWSGGAGLRHRLSSCRGPGPHLVRVPVRPPTLAPTPRRGGQRAWVGLGRWVPILPRGGPGSLGQGPAPLWSSAGN